jgi:hypothetical protein
MNRSAHQASHHGLGPGEFFKIKETSFRRVGFAQYNKKGRDI